MSLQDSELKFQREQMEVVRRKQILKPDETVEAVATLWKHSMAIFFFGVFARLMQKRYLLVVTNARVLLVEVPAFLVRSESKYYGFVAADRPCELKMADPPREQHQMGNVVCLPEAFARFVGKPNARLVWGLMGQKAFAAAAQPCGAPPGDSGREEQVLSH